MADEQKTYVSQQAVVDDLVPGARIVGQRPYYVTVPNEGAGANEPQTKAVQQGLILSIMGPNGEPDEITVGSSDKTVVWNTEPGAPLPKATTVIKGPTKGPTTTGTPGTPIDQWVRLNAQGQPVQPGETAVYIRDPKAPATTQPFKLDEAAGASDPSKWTIIKHPTTGDPMAFVDPATNKVMASIPAAPDKKATGTYENVYDPNDPTKKRIIGLVDKGDPSIFRTVSADPNLPQRQIVTTPTAVYAINADNTHQKLFDIDKTSPFQAVIVDGKPFRFDPNTGVFTPGPVQAHPDIKDQNGLPMIWVGSDEEGKYAYPPGVSPPKTMTGAGTESEWLIWYDAASGTELSRAKNPNYRPPTPTLPPVNTTAPQIPVVDPDKPGQIKWIPNPARVMAPQALSDLAAQLSGVVADPNNPLTLEQAKAIIDAANAQMTAAASAATTTLQTQQQAAQTGAGLLNQRVSAGQGMLGSVLGLAGQRPLAGLAPGAGQALMSDIQGFATQLGGGQEVYDTAARLVRSVDPQGNNPMAQQAQRVLTDILTQYQQKFKQPHPAVAATVAAQQSQAANGLAVPATVQPVAPVAPVAPVGPGVQPVYGASPTAGVGQALGDPYGLTNALGFRAPGMVS